MKPDSQNQSQQLPIGGVGQSEQPVVALGQLWQFRSLSQPGHSHRFLLADCRQRESWARLLHGRTADNIFTSPVYADRRRRTYGGPSADEYVEWFEPVQQLTREHLAGDGSFFVNLKAHVENGERLLYDKDLVIAMKRQWGWKFIDDQCWKRQGFPGRFPNRFKNAHEPVFHFARTTAVKFRPKNVLLDTNLDYASEYDARGREENSVMGLVFDGRPAARNVKSGRFNGALPSNVIEAALELERLSRDELLDMLQSLLEYDDEPGNLIEAYTGAHSRGIRYGATFPVQLPSFFIRAFSDPGDLWVDCFGGSGTTMQAAEENGRIAYLMDDNPIALERTLERMAKIGLAGQLVEDGGCDG